VEVGGIDSLERAESLVGVVNREVRSRSTRRAARGAQGLAQLGHERADVVVPVVGIDIGRPIDDAPDLGSEGGPYLRDLTGQTRESLRDHGTESGDVGRDRRLATIVLVGRRGDREVRQVGVSLAVDEHVGGRELAV
jgi:hypothetical protein